MLYIPRRFAKLTTSIHPISPWLFASDLFLELSDWAVVGDSGEGMRGDDGGKGGEGAGERIGRSPSPPLSHHHGRKRSVAHSPFYMLSRFSSSHIPRRVLAPLLRFCDHSAAGSLYEQGRPGRHRLNP